MKRKRTLCLFAALAVIAAVAAAAPDGLIAFDRNDSVFTVMPNGTGERCLAAGNSVWGFEFPAWSSDGGLLAFSGTQTSAGHNPNPSSDLGLCPKPESCPEPLVIFESGIWVAGADGSNRRRVCVYATDTTFHDHSLSRLVWSADGARLGFIVSSDREGEPGIRDESCYVVRLLDSTPAGIPASDFDAIFGPRLREESPDGSFRLEARELYSVDEFFAAPVLRGPAKRLTHTRPLRPAEEIEMWGGGPIVGEWSPDGRRVVFIPLMTSGDYPYGSLFWVGADGQHQTRLGTGSLPLEDPPLAWSPSGTSLAWEEDGRIRVTDFVHAVRTIAAGYNPSWARAR